MEDLPRNFAEALYRVDPDDAYFNISTGVHSGAPDPWEYSIHDYSIILEGWVKFAPPHWVASAFISKPSDQDEDGKPTKKTTKKGKKVNQENTMAMMKSDPTIMGMTYEGPADPDQVKRLDFTYEIMRQLDSGIPFDELNLDF